MAKVTVLLKFIASLSQLTGWCAAAKDTACASSTAAQVELGQSLLQARRSGPDRSMVQLERDSDSVHDKKAMVFEGQFFGGNQKVIFGDTLYIEGGRVRIGKGRWVGNTFAVGNGGGHSLIARRHGDVVLTGVVKRAYRDLTDDDILVATPASEEQLQVKPFEGWLFGHNEKLVLGETMYLQGGKDIIGKGRWVGSTFAIEWGKGKALIARQSGNVVLTGIVNREYGKLTDKDILATTPDHPEALKEVSGKAAATEVIPSVDPQTTSDEKLLRIENAEERTSTQQVIETAAEKAEVQTSIEKAAAKTSTQQATEEATEKAEQKTGTEKAIDEATEAAEGKKGIEEATEEAEAKTGTEQAIEKATDKAEEKTGTEKATEKATEAAEEKTRIDKVTEKATEAAEENAGTEKVTENAFEATTEKTGTEKADEKATETVVEEGRDMATLKKARQAGTENATENATEAALEKELSSPKKVVNGNTAAEKASTEEAMVTEEEEEEGNYRENVSAPSKQTQLIGNLVTLDEKGMQTVLATKCQLQMDLYIRRLILSLGLDVCDELVLLSLLPLYATGETGTSGPLARTLAGLTEHIWATSSDQACRMTAPTGTCPAEQPACAANPFGADVSPGVHRRRQCTEYIQRPTAGQEQKGKCKLPPGALWCEVRLKNQPSYHMAVYDFDVSDDWVSFNVCQAGFWEENDLSEFGAPGNMLDIGGNVGYHTFAFAQAGWNVTTFEPMAPNLALIDATMCRNPKLAAKIHLNRHGLGTVSQECKMMAPVHNVGDGHVKCGNETLNPSVEFKEIGNFSVRRLDEVLREQNASKVDLVKIDVEGYEGQVFEGAPNFLAQFQPRLIKTEVWDKMVNSTGSEYLMKFEKAGYKFFSDTKCEIPMDAKAVGQYGGDVIMCK